MKKLLTVLLSCLMVFMLFPISVIKADNQEEKQEEKIEISISELTELELNFYFNIMKKEKLQGTIKFFRENGELTIVNIEENGKINLFYSRNTYSKYSKPSERGVIAVLIGIYLIYETVETVTGRVTKGCKALKAISEFDVCGYLLEQVADSLVAASSLKYKVIHSFHKDPNCPYPPHSNHCNMEPYAWWKTEIMPYY